MFFPFQIPAWLLASPPTRLARSADRARFCLSPIRTHEPPVSQTAHLTAGAVLEYGPTEILPPVGPMVPRPARLYRPRRSLGPADPRKIPASRPRTANFRERLTLCWREPDSNHRS